MHPTQTAQIVTHYVRAQWRWRTLRGARLHAYQEQRAQQIATYAAQHSPFYRRHWHGHHLAEWRTLPTVDKQLMMANFDQFNTRGVPLADAMAVAIRAEQVRDFLPTVAGLTVGLSSGTSGHRGLFLVSDAEQSAWAGVILARALHHLRRGQTRVAFFLRAHSNLYARASGSLIDLRYFDLMLPLATAVRALNTYQPHLVIGPPSLLGFLADAQTAGALHIHPQRLISVAEVLEAQDQARLSSTFAAPVHQVYQCTEGLLAVSCPHGSLHLQEDLVAIQTEPLTPDSPPPSSGASEPVTPIVTDLWRRTQPIIRYRLNDVLRMRNQPCPCGSSFRVIEAIEGRCDDVCYFYANDGTLRPFFPDTIRRMILLASSLITDYAAIQTADGQLCIHLALAEPAAHGPERDAVAAAVRLSTVAVANQYGCRAPQLEIEFQLPPPVAGAKRRRVQRLPSIRQLEFSPQ